MRDLLLICFGLILCGCDPKIDFNNLTGSWVPANDTNESGSELTEEMRFENGKYRAVSSSNNDSIIYEVIGEYEINKSTETINLVFTAIQKNGENLGSDSDKTHALKIVELTKEELTLENENREVLNYIKK